MPPSESILSLARSVFLECCGNRELFGRLLKIDILELGTHSSIADKAVSLAYILFDHWEKDRSGGTPSEFLEKYANLAS